MTLPYIIQATHDLLMALKHYTACTENYADFLSHAISQEYARMQDCKHKAQNCVFAGYTIHPPC